MDSKSFETEVLTRLAVIESKIDDYKDTREKADEAYTKSISNEKEIIEIQDKMKWISRAIIGAIITGAIGIVFLIVKIGMGLGS